MSDIFTKQRQEVRVIKAQTVEQKRKDKLWMGLMFSILGIVVLVATYVLYLLNQSAVVLEIKNAPVPVRPTLIDKDQYILLHYDYCKYSNAEGTVESHLISATTVLALPPVTDTTKKDCKKFDAPYPIPGQAPPGKYHYHFKTCYQINPLKRVCTEWSSKEFTILGSEDKKQIKL